LLRKLALVCAACATTGSGNCAVTLEDVVLCMEATADECPLRSIMLALLIEAVDQVKLGG
jgi:hypothetical protein